MSSCRECLSSARGYLSEIDVASGETIRDMLDGVEAELMRDDVVDHHEILVEAIEIIQAAI